jgi:hypothetical protein
MYRNLKDSMLAPILINCTQLQVLKLEGIPNLTDASIQSIAASCPLFSVIYFDQLVKITDASLAPLFQTALYLHKIMLNGCKKLTDASISLITERNCRLIQIGKQFECLIDLSRSFRNIYYRSEYNRHLQSSKSPEISQPFAVHCSHRRVIGMYGQKDVGLESSQYVAMFDYRRRSREVQERISCEILQIQEMIFITLYILT